MASSLEFNKICAAVLVGGICASLSGFIAQVLVHPKPLKEAVFAIAPSEKEPPGGAAAAPPEPIEKLLASADPKAGQEVAKKCAQCHTFDQGGKPKIGPNLYGVVGGKKGHEQGFSYSQAMLDKGGDWSPEDLNQFLTKPSAFVKGTKMTFAGLPKAEDRANVIKYLETLK
jgi:cytochrome c